VQTVKTVGLNIAKSIFQVHGMDAAGKFIFHRQLKRRYVLAFFEKLPPYPSQFRWLKCYAPAPPPSAAAAKHDGTANCKVGWHPEAPPNSWLWGANTQSFDFGVSRASAR
jgi:hypothetical protein